uniref:Uncharacterized protein n=1 Tax=Wuchereria bancrofti TaxID=6293 RepID=A0A1I8EPU9_WUCBA
MPAKVHCGGLFLGDTIQEKTRTLLNWSDEHYPTIMVNTTQKSIRKCDRRPTIPTPTSVPTSILIASSSSSSSTTAISYRSPEREAQVFERLRQLVPMLPFDRSAYQVLIETVSQVMDLEQQLEQLNEQTNSAKNSLWIEQRNLVSNVENSLFPDDLKTVDVTAFKRLLCSGPHPVNTSKTVHFNFLVTNVQIANYCYIMVKSNDKSNPVSFGKNYAIDRMKMVQGDTIPVQ